MKKINLKEEFDCKFNYPFKMDDIPDSKLLEVYKKGFEDESKHKFDSTFYNSGLLLNAYNIGSIHYMIGDDLSDCDFYSEEEILKEIKGNFDLP
jgi:hypothetical protein